MFSLYLKRYAYPEDLIEATPSPNLGITVVIPSYGEPDLSDTLHSLKHCLLPECDVEVIVVVNDSEQSASDLTALNIKSIEENASFIRSKEEQISFHLLYQKLPAKHAGVGLARKIGMDQAIRRFQAVGNDGILASLDADCRVENNYLIALEQHFNKFPASPGCSIYFEHPLQGSLQPAVYRGIAAYELHLRYYIHALRYCRHPYAFQTVGSSMAVRCSAYVKQGGMNRRKAGEDFYFLQKIFSLGNFTELVSTTVIPSPRPSLRVPFGTGKAIHDWCTNNVDNFLTYNNLTFKDFKVFIECSLKDNWVDPKSSWRHFPESIKSFLGFSPFESKVLELRRQTASKAQYQKRFFSWCNGFFAFKFANHCREHGYPDLPVEQMASWLLKEGYNIEFAPDREALLKNYRDLDRGLLAVTPEVIANRRDP